MTLEDIRGLLNKHKDSGDKMLDNVRQDLLNYYATDEGIKELRNSPHSHLPPEAAVELLMQDVTMMVRKELK